MQKKISKTPLVTLMAFLGLVWISCNFFTYQVNAQIINPAIGELGGSKNGQVDTASVTEAASGATVLKQFIRLWGNAITIGAILVIGYLILGAIEWINSGGDSGKLEKARQKMMHAIIGLVILVTSFILIGFISSLLFGESFDLLNLKFFTPTSTSNTNQ